MKFLAKKQKKIMFKKFRDNPEKFPLKTPSGKIEISSKTIENYKLTDCLSHPSWFEPYEWLGKVTNYPLHLISNQQFLILLDPETLPSLHQPLLRPLMNP